MERGHRGAAKVREEGGEPAGRATPEKGSGSSRAWHQEARQQVPWVPLAYAATAEKREKRKKETLGLDWRFYRREVLAQFGPGGHVPPLLKFYCERERLAEEEEKERRERLPGGARGCPPWSYQRRRSLRGIGVQVGCATTGLHREAGKWALPCLLPFPFSV